ncbi:copper amine oxidase [Priestia aryabhattai]|uniref:copper amine oxidase n=1 Tax=Priestia TaxID=2800373 RepID=UPI000B9FA3DF|nr:copper amine oxidase [Priestia aryabhattai]USY53512.1 copper amine oxidase [Bacillus sp. 1780r2a1]
MKISKKLIAPVLGASLLVPTMVSAAEPTQMQPTVETPAADLRSTLDQLLSEHFVLAVTAMTKAYDGAEDANEAFKALDENAADMTPAIASVYGDEGAKEFERIFREHNNYTDDLVKAAKEKDESARAEAEKEVQEFVDEFSAFLGTATEGKLPEETAKEAVRLHENQVLETFDDYVEGDYEGAYQSFREGFKHMYVISDALSNAIVTQMPEKFENSKSDTPAADLRSTLNSLASEHFALAAIGMQKGFDGAADYDFVNWAEDAHTADFKAAIASIYGDEGAAQFEKIWQGDHINAQAELASAKVKGDKEAEAAAQEKLKKFADEFGAFLGAATEENLPSGAAKDAVLAHEQTVIKAFEQYASGNYNGSYDTFREGYKLMFGVGQALGDAIVKQSPDQFAETKMPTDMPKTGLGGASESTTNPLTIVWTALGALAALTAAVVVRRKVQASK